MKIKSIRKCISAVVSLLLVVSLAFPSYAAAYLLNVPHINQVYSHACWCATGTSVCQYYGFAISMTDFSNKVGYDMTADTMRSIYVIQSGLGQYGITSTFVDPSTVPSMNTIINQINAGKPMIANVTNHFVVIKGYDSSTNDVYVMDPGKSRYNQNISCNYFDMLNYLNNDYNYDWGATLINITA